MTENEQVSSANTQQTEEVKSARVLENNQRIEFTEQFAPPSTAYTLEHVWGTTYSVSLSAMLMTLFAMECSGKVPVLSEGQTVNKAQQLEILHRNLPKLTILYQQGLIHQDAQLPLEVLSMMMTSLLPQIRAEGSFHPKVWLFAFKHNTSPDQYQFRLLVTSRNLTQDTDFDAAVVFESKEKDEPQDHQPLFDLFGASISEEWRERLKKVTFSNGMYEKLKDVSSIHTIISPFLDVEQINRFTGLKNLFSTKKALDSLDLSAIQNKNLNYFILRDLTKSNQEGGDEQVPHVNLHAKLYFSKSFLYLGSRNCTSRGWNDNVEFMIRLNFGQKPENLLKSLVYDPDSEMPQLCSSRNCAQALFEPYTPQKSETEEEGEDEKKRLIEFLRTIDCEASYNAQENTLTFSGLSHPPMPLAITPFMLSNIAGMEQTWKDMPLCWKIKPEQRNPFFCVRRLDLPGFKTLLIANVKDGSQFASLEDYVSFVESTFTPTEYYEYLCSIGEVPLDDLEIVSANASSSSGNTWNNRDHRFLERLAQNIVARPELAALYREKLDAYKGDAGSDELAEFFKYLEESWKSNIRN